jgi:Ca2+-binding RTX toxin-like protein
VGGGAVVLGLLIPAASAGVGTPTCFGATATIIGTDASEPLHGTPGADVIVGLGGDDVIDGRGGDDLLCGYSDEQGEDDAADTLEGNAGDDSMRGGGDPALQSFSFAIGGTGDDLMVNIGVSYFEAPHGVTVDLAAGTATDWGTDTLTNVDTLVGSRFDDTLSGNAEPFSADDECGCDRIYAEAGDDVIHGRNGNDKLLGNGGDDVLSGGRGGDQLFPGAGRDKLRGGRNGDMPDQAVYSDASHAVTVDLAAGRATGSGRDDLIGVEDVFGSYHRDTIRGDDGPNRLVGGEGSDDVGGRGGRDHLLGGLGDDLLVGGRGHDLAAGQGSIDTCSAEVEHTCER